ncbi:uncharacterized protein [Palaemon carinicauda]|uniref:uncharacterized protein isoform X1 n=1 Tax=Palaemon carinicauda TaxID=392227 RepID=UPI0035B59E79
MADSDSKWLRKATDLERMFEIGHQLQMYLTHYTLDLASAKPIEEDFLRRALTHLYRKVPVLRVCLRERNSELWLREMDACNIDLQVIKEGNLSEERHKLTKYEYNSKDGPLWCVRLITFKASTPVNEKFPFDYALVFGAHHSIADGTTYIKICNLLCNIMNDLMGGLAIDDDQQMGELKGEEELLSLYEQEMARLRENETLRQEIKRELQEGSEVRPLIRHICKIPGDLSTSTQDVSTIIDQNISKQFHRKAKSMGVSLHSALTSLINFTLVELLQEQGIIQDRYNIRAGHVIDIRRYYTRDSSRALGVHGPLFRYKAPFWVPKNMLPVFWETAKEFHKKLHSDISTRKVLTVTAYRLMTEDINQNFKDIFREDGEPNYYYTITNMGNLAGTLSEGGQYVSTQKLTRFCSLRSGSSFMIIFFHTFRDLLNINIAYSTRFLTYEFVHRLLELISVHMKSTSDQCLLDSCEGEI